MNTKIDYRTYYLDQMNLAIARKEKYSKYLPAEEVAKYDLIIKYYREIFEKIESDALKGLYY